MGRSKAVGNGEGSIVTIRRGGKIAGYAPEVTIGWKDGKRLRKRGPLQRTRGEARIALAALQQLQQTGMVQLEKAQKVRDYFPYWLEKSFTPQGRARSIETYGWAIDKVIILELGDLTLGAVSTLRLDVLFSALHQRGMAPRTVQLVRTVLNQGYKRAIKWKLVAHNPVPDTQAPKIGRSQAKALTDAQTAAFLLAAQGERLEAALRLMLALGLRRGEVCGLRWADIDLAAGTLTVQGTLGQVRGQGLIYGPPKSESSRRSFRLPPTLITLLRRYQVRAAAERKAFGDRWQPSAYVFVSARDGGALHPGRLYDAFRIVAEHAGLTGFRPHDLRHSCASFLHAEGVPLKTISAYLGHADTQVTNNVYIHLFDDALHEAAAVMARRIDVGAVAPVEADLSAMATPMAEE